MELPHVGKTCSNRACGLHDFLPIACPDCGLDFCRDHALPDAHGCTAAVARPAAAAGPVAERPPCGVAACRSDARVTVPCAACAQSFCPAHRHQDQHACAALADVADPQAKARALLAKNFPKPAPTPSTPPSAPAPARPAPKKKIPLLELMKLKQIAKGAPSIPAAQRSYHRVRLPDGKPDAVVYFSTVAPVGRAIDVVFPLTGRSWNETVVAHQVALVCESSGETLVSALPLGEAVASGETLVLRIEPRAG
ncbi:hypothetical protein H9P43_004432 [Blastocladiella emersonii ATCC 22665]|nr:hypothetical protein H9P43_004432 [Blastocladiella emersonii ATCC 22665]